MKFLYNTENIQQKTVDIVSKYKLAFVQLPAWAAVQMYILAYSIQSINSLSKNMKRSYQPNVLHPLYTILLKTHTICLPVILSFSVPKFWVTLLFQTCRSLNKISNCAEMDVEPPQTCAYETPATVAGQWKDLKCWPIFKVWDKKNVQLQPGNTSRMRMEKKIIVK